MIAQLPEIPWSQTGGWFLGFLGVMAVVAFSLTIIVNFRKVFGKRPPVDDELRDIRGKISSGNSALHSRINDAEKLIAQAREDLLDHVNERFTNLAIDRQRTLDNLYEKGINPLQAAVNKILGKLEEMDRNRSNRR